MEAIVNQHQLVEYLEQEVGKAIYRRIRVKESKDASGKIEKEPFGERNQWSPEQIFKDRGYPDKDPNSNKVFTDYSIALKHCPGIWCVDVDTKDPAQLECEFITRLRKDNTFYTETTKGFHYYIKCYDAPTDFTNEIDVFKDFKGDFLGRAKGNNVWEKKTRVVSGKHLARYEWSDISQYIDQEVIYRESAQDKKKRLRAEKAKKLKEKKNRQEDPHGLETTISNEKLKDILDRIDNSGEGKRWDDWWKVGACLFNTFQGKATGLRFFQDWSAKSSKNCDDTTADTYDKYREDHPDPCGWKTLAMMANQDNPRNKYEQLYMEGGSDAVTAELNKWLAFNSGTCNYCRRFENVGRLEDQQWGVFTDTELEKAYRKYTFFVVGDNGKMKKMNPFRIWEEHINRRDVKRIAFDPRPRENADPDIWNIWNGYAISPEEASVYDEDDCQALRDHIYNIWCRGKADHYEYVINWFAHILQKPWEKIGVLLALQSEEGAGKGVVMEVIHDIMGSNTFQQVASAGGVVGRFNSSLEGKCLVDLDEAIWGGDKSMSSIMKNLITERKQQIERKGKEIYEIDNSTAFMITTNNELFAGVDKGARRYACLKLDNRFAGVENDETREYFRQVRGPGATGSGPDPKVVGAFAKYLYKRNIRGWSARRCPRTELLQDQIERGWASPLKWWKDMLTDGRWGMPNYEVAYRNIENGYNGPEKKNEYDVKLEYFGFISNKVNGRVIQAEAKTLIGDKKYYMRKDFPGSVHPQDGETRRQFVRRVYYEELPYDAQNRCVCNEQGHPREYTIEWEGQIIQEYEKRVKTIYKGYYPKWLFNVYLEAHKNRRLGYGNPDNYNAWCQKMRKIYNVVTKKHGSGINQEITWQVHPLDDAREFFSVSQQWDYEWDEATEVDCQGGKIINNENVVGSIVALPDMCLIESDEEDPVPE